MGPHRRVSEMQVKLHPWAAADPGRRFDDLFNLVHDPATLLVAFERVAGNTGARTPGVDGLRVADVEKVIGALGAGVGRPLGHRHHTLTTPAGSAPRNNPPWKSRTDRLLRDAPQPNDEESPVDKVRTNPINHCRSIRAQ